MKLNSVSVISGRANRRTAVIDWVRHSDYWSRRRSLDRIITSFRFKATFLLSKQDVSNVSKRTREAVRSESKDGDCE